MDIRIEPTTARHIESFHKCLDSVCRERIYLSCLRAPSLDSVRRFVSTIIHQHYTQFMAVNDEGMVVGWCDILPGTRDLNKHVGTLGIGVRKAYRGLGIGRRLMEVALEDAHQKGLERIELEVFESNTRAIELYKKLGFQIEGVKENYRKLDGQYDNAVIMALLFVE